MFEPEYENVKPDWIETVESNLLEVSNDVSDLDLRNRALRSVATCQEVPSLWNLFGVSGGVAYDKEIGVKLILSDPEDVNTIRHEFAHIIHLSNGYDVADPGRKKPEESGGFYKYNVDDTSELLLRSINYGESTPEIDSLMEAVNRAFLRIKDANDRRDDSEMEKLTFGRRYAAKNAGETFAVLHERYNSDSFVERYKARRSMKRHDGLLKAYKAVFRS